MNKKWVNYQDPEYDYVWNVIEEKLGNIMRTVADICLGKGVINKTEHERYFVSGILKMIGLILSKFKFQTNYFN